MIDSNEAEDESKRVTMSPLKSINMSGPRSSFSKRRCMGFCAGPLWPVTWSGAHA